MPKNLTTFAEHTKRTRTHFPGQISYLDQPLKSNTTTVSFKPTTVITATTEQATVHVKDLDMFVLLSNFSKILQPYYILEKFPKHIGISRNGKKAAKLILPPTVAPRVTKDEVISVSADGPDETSQSSASSDRVRQTASGSRLRDMLRINWK